MTHLNGIRPTYHQLISFTFPLAIALLFISCNKEPKSFEPKNYSIEQLYDNIDIYGVDFNADESKILIGTNKSGIYNVGELNIADTTITMLTKSNVESNWAQQYVPGSDDFIYTADKGGDENSHIYLANNRDTLSKDLTPWPGSANSFFDWSADKKSMLITSNQRDNRFFDLWQIDIETQSSQMVFQNDSSYDINLISSTQRFIALSKSITTDKNELYLYDTQQKTYKKISNNTESSWSATAFEKNDSILYFTTNDNAEFSYLVKYNLHTGVQSKYYEDKWEVAYMSISENEKYHTILVNEDGKNKLLLYDHATNKPLIFPAIPDGDVLNIIISYSEKSALLTVGSSTSPRNLYHYDFESKTLKKLTNTLNPEINEGDLVKAEVVRFKSFDGLEIPAIYYRPHQASKAKPVGALVMVHGGPGGQSRVG
ncbi:MAG: S9 family peptidase, partial [Saprospiraceae bacterium]